MDHSDHAGHGGDAGAGAGHAMMIPYFHFTTGDHLFFKEWVPSSPGAIAGACIGLFLLAIIERWLTAIRAVFEHHWQQRALLLSSRYSEGTSSLSSSSRTDGKSLDESGSVKMREEGGPTTQIPPVLPRLRLRTIPPFVASHDIPRGILHAFQAALGYLLMLAVMTFRVEFILCIVAGLGIGEAFFGRLSNGSVH
ncbi:copper transporter [Coprinopsis cinerea okayama7|uniref:Copper transport protein n=1 Tax=Coprinopsis cinerea (strain Okayama-7 / 130 / ATCC MYA-4618 / FGSC 9003) TaxID=240176 RepID=D6RJW4_COPC7|nr:copper transporter [Coprinopsis cinerea okayama7\|eukprot:XP_002912076.1 copper transporter [Coprinopsis cinerea okayama7\